MTLREMLATKTGTAVKIGAATSYLYCDYVIDQTVPTLEKINNEIINNKQKNLSEFTRTLPVIEKLIEQLETKLNLVNNRKERKSIQKEIDIAKAKKNGLSKLIKKYSNFLANPINILDRKVIDSYPSTINHDHTCIIIEGDESGSYWTIDEYINRQAYTEE